MLIIRVLDWLKNLFVIEVNMDQSLENKTNLGWRVYLERKVLIMLALGFSSGLPILLVFGTLSFWLREAEVSRTDIGFF